MGFSYNTMILFCGIKNALYTMQNQRGKISREANPLKRQEYPKLPSRLWRESLKRAATVAVLGFIVTNWPLALFFMVLAASWKFLRSCNTMYQYKFIQVSNFSGWLSTSFKKFIP
jgi:hypothetical protein